MEKNKEKNVPVTKSVGPEEKGGRVPYNQLTFVTKRIAAEMLGMSQRQFDLVVRPHVKAYQPAPGSRGKLLFRRDELEAFVESRCVSCEIAI